MQSRRRWWSCSTRMSACQSIWTQQYPGAEFKLPYCPAVTMKTQQAVNVLRTDAVFWLSYKRFVHVSQMKNQHLEFWTVRKQTRPVAPPHWRDCICLDRFNSYDWMSRFKTVTELFNNLYWMCLFIIAIGLLNTVVTAHFTTNTFTYFRTNEPIFYLKNWRIK